MSKRENKLQKNNERTLMEAYFLNGSNDCCNGNSSTGHGNNNGNDNGNNNGSNRK